MLNDEAHIAAMERSAGFRLADPKGRIDNDAMTEASRRELVERRGTVRMPRLSFLDPARLLDFEKKWIAR